MTKILVGIDGSPHHVKVLQAAAKIARDTDAKLILFRAVGLPKDLPNDAYMLAPADVVTLLEEQARVDLEAAAREVPSMMIERLQVKIGIPWQAICSAAIEDNVDMIVIGSHGYGMLDKLLGTTAAKVVNHADRSVLVVR